VPTRSASPELERELWRKDKALAETAAILALRKKMNTFWAKDSEDAGPHCQSDSHSLSALTMPLLLARAKR
jgi:hypothetical protein